MKNKLVFRIFGALASALIIVSVFIPFVSVTGYSTSLWETHSAVGTLYLPIMIIVFGAIGVLFFSINIKTELAYATSGALTFYLVMQTIPIIDQGTFKTLGVGYYCLAIGTIITGTMAFICNLRTKQKQIENVTEPSNTISMIDQIDKLYNEQDNSNNSVENIIQPIPIDTNVINNSIPIENNINDTHQFEQHVAVMQPQVATETISQQQTTEPVQPNPVVTEFNVPMEQTVQPNPVASEFNVPTEQPVQPNPVASEFNVPMKQPVQPNPVVTEFNVPMEQPVQSMTEFGISPTLESQVQQPINNQPKFDLMGEQQTNNNKSNLDIFG